MAHSRSLVRWGALLVGLPVVALTLVIVADLIPDGRVMWRLHAAIVDGSLAEDSYTIGMTGGTLDGHSECKRMTVGLGAPEGMSVFESAVRSPTLGSCESAVPKILSWAQGDGLMSSYQYYRYWHGSAVVLRPSVAMFGVVGTCLVMAAALVAVTIGLALELSRAVGRGAAAMFLAPLLLTTDFIDLPGALVHAIGMVAAVGAAALLMRYLRADSTVGAFGAAGFAAGGAFLFFADLTNPDAAWALVTCSAAVVAVAAAELRPAVRRVAAATIGWIAGFVWLWVSKWFVASLVIGFDTVREVVVDQAEVRLSGEVVGYGNSRLAGLQRAWEEWSNEPLTMVAAAVLAVIAVVVVWRRRDLRATWSRRLLLGAAALIPFAWHVAMRQHTIMHGWFTYRSFAVAFGVVLLALTARLESDVRAAPDPGPDPGGDDQANIGSTASGSMP